MAILLSEVLIGRIESTGTHTARVQMLSDPGSRVKVRLTVYTDRRFQTPLPGAAGKTMEFLLEDAEPGMREAVRSMKVGGRRAVLIREEVIPMLAKTLGGIQTGTQVAIRIELLDVK